MHGRRVALSQYDPNGEPRRLADALLPRCGARRTDSLNRKNTHLLCPRIEGDKCVKAAEWGVEFPEGGILALDTDGDGAVLLSELSHFVCRRCVHSMRILPRRHLLEPCLHGRACQIGLKRIQHRIYVFLECMRCQS